jgi:hypothetical protein
MTYDGEGTHDDGNKSNSKANDANQTVGSRCNNMNAHTDAGF